jgi:hypothetical protein
MIFAGAGKVAGHAPPEVAKQLQESGLADKIMLIGIGEITAAVLLLAPWTASIGILLASSFWGGAILLHMTKGDPYLIQSILLVAMWVGAGLRNPAMWWSFRRERRPAAEPNG